MWQFKQTDSVERVIQDFSNISLDVRNHLGHTLLHMAVELLDISTSHVLGQPREVCYILQLPTYAYLNFKNYFTETFAHVANFLGKWPLAFRKLVQKNRAINLSGKKEGAIELDAFLEAEKVQLLKISQVSAIQF